MKWVNFLILAGVIYKYGHKPFSKFIKGQKEDLSIKIDELESEKARVIGEINAAQTHTEENKQKLIEMKARLIAQGETRKQEIIDQARNQSGIMIEAARKKMENRIIQAKEKLKMELADLAFEQATQKLPQMITDADNQLFIDNYMRGMNVG
ncbi:ATP synthase subunit b [Desulfosarcina ovata subsp. sediminis]|uniref:ATP synthase subunit b n=1 Tax=Desulfosarcina ovata subsp. sediminis TaxID=885957 RepID=A0A5K7ZU94_9BACT|nr:ATP synthase F0 subunit B [Desulfosarcina ovata]BBO83744.1 ATP synthase subunit b [Desulfosarcina ovata subsp. sediminis]